METARFCITSPEFCIKSDEFCIKSDEFCITKGDLCISNDELTGEIDYEELIDYLRERAQAFPIIM